MTPEWFQWSPWIAIGLGLVARLGARRSWKTWFGVTGVVMLIQVLAWMALFVQWHVAREGWDEQWQAALGAGFLWGLLVALPYTILGSAIGGALVSLFRSSRRMRRF
jgi:hypothetical protein